jgi:hypothetical protein
VRRRRRPEKLGILITKVFQIPTHARLFLGFDLSLSQFGRRSALLSQFFLKYVGGNVGAGVKKGKQRIWIFSGLLP